MQYLFFPTRFKSVLSAPCRLNFNLNEHSKRGWRNNFLQESLSFRPWCFMIASKPYIKATLTFFLKPSTELLTNYNVNAVHTLLSSEFKFDFSDVNKTITRFNSQSFSRTRKEWQTFLLTSVSPHLIMLRQVYLKPSY